MSGPLALSFKLGGRRLQRHLPCSC
jgi:hypothetical protein